MADKSELHEEVKELILDLVTSIEDIEKLAQELEDLLKDSGKVIAHNIPEMDCIKQCFSWLPIVRLRPDEGEKPYWTLSTQEEIDKVKSKQDDRGVLLQVGDL